MHRKSLLATLSLLFIFATPQAAQAQEYSVLPHSARYSITLIEAKVGEVTMLDGGLSVDLVKGCKNWTLQSNLNLAAGNQDGAGFVLVMNQAATESLDGRRFEFKTDVVVNDAPEETYQGIATLEEDGRGEAEFTLPEQQRVRLPQDTLFPINAMRTNLKAAWGAQQVLTNYIYFDGSELSAWRATDLVAGTPEPLDAQAQDPDGITKIGQAKRVVTTLFDLTHTDAEPISTYISDILPNGIVTRLTIDLGFMVAEARLIEVLAIPEPDC